MDTFEFAQIPVAIVLGFGISEILAGWGHQLRHRNEQPFSGLQLIGSTYVLMWSFRYLWIQWSVRPEIWNFGAYLLSAAPAVLLALAAHAIRFDPSFKEHDPMAQYERSRQPVCWLLALLPVILSIRLAYLLGHSQASPADAPELWLVLPVGFLVTALVFAWMARTRRTRTQWIGWGISWVATVVLWAVFLPDLAPPSNG